MKKIKKLKIELLDEKIGMEAWGWPETNRYRKLKNDIQREEKRMEKKRKSKDFSNL